MSAREPRAAEPDALRSLLAAYQGGDLSAFDGIHEQLAPTVRRFLLSLARDSAWADDLVQETFLQIHRSRRTYNAAYPVLPWVFAIARHVFLMSRRTRRRKGDFDGDAVPADSVPALTASHEAAMVARDRVSKAMHALSPGTRRAVWLHHVLGWGFADVARQLGIGEAAAKLRSSRGIAHLRRSLSEKPRRDDV